MTKLRWNRAHDHSPYEIAPNYLERAADRILAAKPKRAKVKPGVYGKPVVQRGHAVSQQAQQREIVIVQGADCPWSLTPGVRTVYIFNSVKEAHDAGFTYVT